tara:strand:+ start:5630 stop:6193 length:564 start_codon:yes stop_codon:yes gene_type:complete
MLYPLLFVDVETTHLNHTIGEIIEICIIKEFPNGKTIRFESKFRPQHLITADPKSLEINGYNPDDWKDAPTFKECSEHIFHLLEFGIIVGHNVNFDIDYINTQLIASGLKKRVSYLKIDTQSLCWEHLPLPSASMKMMRLFFGWSMDNSHTAAKDTDDCRKLYHILNRASIFQRWWWKFKFRFLFSI